MAEATGKGAGDRSAVLILHLRQQVERVREELRRVHEEQYKRHAQDHLGEARTASEDEDEAPAETEGRRRVARTGERGAALAALASGRPIKRSA